MTVSRLFLVLFLSLFTLSGFASPPRVAVLALNGTRPAPNLADSIAVLLSQNPDLEILERSDVDRLLEEGALMQCAGNESNRTKLGRLLDLDYFISIRGGPGSEGYVIELIDGLTGKIYSSRKATSTTPSQLASLAAEIIAARPKLKKSSTSIQVAVLDFESDQDQGIQSRALATRLSAQTREMLSTNGLEVLDRSIVDRVAQEQIMRDKGFTEASKTSAKLLKSDYVVCGKIENGGVTLRILDIAGSSTLATRHFDLDPAGAVPKLSEKSLAWLANSMGKTVRPALFIKPVIQPEALQPFYEGLAFYQAGRYFDAIDSFEKSYRLSDKFQDAYLWEARCYDALGLKPIGDALRLFTNSELVSRGGSRPVSVQQTEGITFAGITGGASLPERLKMELAAVDALSQRKGLALQLPSDLARFCDEYDVFVGVPNVELKNWSSLPNLLTRWSLQGKVIETTGGEPKIEWCLLDTLSLTRKKLSTSALSGNSADWEREFGAAFEQLLQISSDAEVPPLSSALDDIPICVKNLDKDRIVANRALLELILQQPDHPTLWARHLDKKGNDDEGLQGALNYGLREYLIQKLPPTNEYCRWLRLIQLRYFLPFDAHGRAFSGKNIDVFEALEDFKKSNRGHITAAIAEYMILWQQLSKIPLPELIQRLQQLRQDLEKAEGQDRVKNLHIFKGMAGNLEILAQLAQGRSADQPELPEEPYPTRIVPLFKDQGIELRRSWEWLCNEWEPGGHEGLDSQEEALAALNILGRGSERMRIDPDWLTASPHSLAMLSFAIRGVHEVDYLFGRPIRHPFDADLQRKEYLQLVEYCESGLLRELDRATTAKRVDFLEGLCRLFVFHLTHYAYHITLDDARFESIRQELGAKLTTAMQRNGNSGFSAGSLIWMTMPRLFPDPKNPPRGNTDDDYLDPQNYLAKEQSSGTFSWANSPVENPAWSNTLNENFFSRLPPKDMAAILLKYEGRMQQLYDRTDLSQQQTGFVLNYALMLFHARRYLEAEKWFLLITKQQESDLTRYGKFQEYKASACVYAGYIRLVSGRETDSVALLKQAIAITDIAPKNLIVQVLPSGELRYNTFHEGDPELKAVALRLLDEARISIQPEALPKNILRISMQVPQLQNTSFQCYVRIPKGYSVDAAKKYKILMVLPSVNHSTPETCLDGNSWAKFADEQDLFLLCPQLQRLFTNEGSESDPRDWPGEATLNAIDQLAQKYHVDKEKLLLHGYGAGATFVDYFARWKPERVRAVSSHSSDYLPYYEFVPETKPLSAMKNIPNFITCGEDDDRIAAGILYCTFLKDAGVPVLWKSWPEVRHVVSPRMEIMAQAFLAYYANPEPGPPEFMGDIRTWTFAPVDSATAKAIPSQWQQPLPDRSIAGMWGSEVK